MWIFSNIRDYFGNHVENITTEHVTINDFVLGELTVLDVVEYDDEDNGLGYSIEVAKTVTKVTKGLIKVRTATALGRGYYSIGSVTPVFSAEWSAYVCVTTENTANSAAWSNYVCAKEEEAAPETLTYSVALEWVNTVNNGSLDGIGGVVTLKNSTDTVVDTKTVTNYTKTLEFNLSETNDGTGFKIDLSGLKAYIDGIEAAKELFWSLSPEAYPQSTLVTPIYSTNKEIYVKVNTV